MAKYQKYAEYKDSEVEWLGEIPSHWSATQVKYGYLITLGKMLQSFPKSNVDEFKPYLKAQNIQPNGVNIDQVESMWFSPDECKKLLLKKGDVLVSEGGDVGRSAIWNSELDECYIQNAINRVRPKYVNDSRYFLYWMAFLKSTNFINIICNKATIAHYTAEKLEGSPIFLPSGSEQIEIANFLDHETAKIDSLIEKQQQLIKLLKEKRQAVISHAVTEGLNPNVPMKDSGVEWLGQVPEHWRVVKFKYLTILFEQGWSPQCDSRPAELQEYGVLKVGCVNYGKFTSTENKALPIELAPKLQYLIKKGDLLISRANTKELVGSAAIVDREYGNLILCDKLYRLRFLNSVLPELVALYLTISPVREQIELGASGASSSMQNIGQDTIKELTYILPPLNEAILLLDAINNSVSHFNILLEKADHQIEVLEERRTALISAAVTGKIDVRNWQNPNKNNEENMEFGA